MTIPCQLTLRTTPDGVRMFAEPVKELTTLHGKKHTWTDQTLKPKNNLLEKVRGDLFDIRGEFEPTGAATSPTRRPRPA